MDKHNDNEMSDNDNNDQHDGQHDDYRANGQQQQHEYDDHQLQLHLQGNTPPPNETEHFQQVAALPQVDDDEAARARILVEEVQQVTRARIRLEEEEHQRAALASCSYQQEQRRVQAEMAEELSAIRRLAEITRLAELKEKQEALALAAAAALQLPPGLASASSSSQQTGQQQENAGNGSVLTQYAPIVCDISPPIQTPTGTSNITNNESQDQHRQDRDQGQIPEHQQDQEQEQQKPGNVSTDTWNIISACLATSKEYQENQAKASSSSSAVSASSSNSSVISNSGAAAAVFGTSRNSAFVRYVRNSENNNAIDLGLPSSSSTSTTSSNASANGSFSTLSADSPASNGGTSTSASSSSGSTESLPAATDCNNNNNYPQPYAIQQIDPEEMIRAAYERTLRIEREQGIEILRRTLEGRQNSYQSQYHRPLFNHNNDNNAMSPPQLRFPALPAPGHLSPSRTPPEIPLVVRNPGKPPSVIMVRIPHTTTMANYQPPAHLPHHQRIITHAPLSLMNSTLTEGTNNNSNRTIANTGTSNTSSMNSVITPGRASFSSSSSQSNNAGNNFGQFQGQNQQATASAEMPMHMPFVPGRYPARPQTPTPEREQEVPRVEIESQEHRMTLSPPTRQMPRTSANTNNNNNSNNDYIIRGLLNNPPTPSVMSYCQRRAIKMAQTRQPMFQQGQEQASSSRSNMAACVRPVQEPRINRRGIPSLQPHLQLTQHYQRHQQQSVAAIQQDQERQLYLQSQQELLMQQQQQHDNDRDHELLNNNGRRSSYFYWPPRFFSGQQQRYPPRTHTITSSMAARAAQEEESSNNRYGGMNTYVSQLNLGNQFQYQRQHHFGASNNQQQQQQNRQLFQERDSMQYQPTLYPNLDLTRMRFPHPRPQACPGTTGQGPPAAASLLNVLARPRPPPTPTPQQQQQQRSTVTRGNFGNMMGYNLEEYHRTLKMQRDRYSSIGDSATFAGGTVIANNGNSLLGNLYKERTTRESNNNNNNSDRASYSELKQLMQMAVKLQQQQQSVATLNNPGNLGASGTTSSATANSAPGPAPKTNGGRKQTAAGTSKDGGSAPKKPRVRKPKATPTTTESSYQQRRRNKQTASSSTATATGGQQLSNNGNRAVAGTGTSAAGRRRQSRSSSNNNNLLHYNGFDPLSTLATVADVASRSSVKQEIQQQANTRNDNNGSNNNPGAGVGAGDGNINVIKLEYLIGTLSAAVAILTRNFHNLSVSDNPNSNNKETKEPEDKEEEEVEEEEEEEDEDMDKVLDLSKRSNSEGKLCIWCGKPISLCSNAENGFGTEFCSEICFDQFRRDSFKKRSACIWCNNNSKGNRTAINNNNNNSENGLSFSTSPLDETKFCSENCLAQFKVRLFCEETSAHLDQLKGANFLDFSPPTINNHNSSNSINDLITPDLWLVKSPPIGCTNNLSDSIDIKPSTDQSSHQPSQLKSSLQHNHNNESQQLKSESSSYALHNNNNNNSPQVSRSSKRASSAPLSATLRRSSINSNGNGGSSYPFHSKSRFHSAVSHSSSQSQQLGSKRKNFQSPHFPISPAKKPNLSPENSRPVVKSDPNATTGIISPNKSIVINHALSNPTEIVSISTNSAAIGISKNHSDDNTLVEKAAVPVPPLPLPILQNQSFPTNSWNSFNYIKSFLQPKAALILPYPLLLPVPIPFPLPIPLIGNTMMNTVSSAAAVTVPYDELGTRRKFDSIQQLD